MVADLDNLGRMKILLIDDDDVDRERVRRIFKNLSTYITLDEAEAVNDSITLIKKNEYDCILSDYRLGATTGLDFLKFIRDSLNIRTPVIIITGVGDEEIAANAIRLGAGDYIRKSQLDHNYLIRSLSHVVERSRLEKKLHDMAHFDELTGLANRHLLLDRLQQTIYNTERSKKLAALAFIDLDNFKPVNDRYGHSAGDNVLISIAKRLESTLRASDTICRIGGDEFVLLLTELRTTYECQELLQRVLKAIEEPIIVSEEKEVSVSASIGVTIVDKNASDADSLLRRADQTMYKVKQSGRNNIMFFDHKEELRLNTRRALLESVSYGIKHNQFHLYYQPKINLSTSCFLGVEALLRWQNPIHGLLTPDYFIEALTHRVLSITIGEWVLNEAVKQVQAWSQLGKDIKTSVNISAPHLQSNNFLENLENLLSSTQLISEAIELEVVESVAINDIDAAANVLSRCRDLGVSVALDDFGTGFSSLSYLKKLPLDTLKIDKEFIQNMLSDKDDRAIVESIIGLSTNFGYHLIAEGVESFEHQEMLRNLGCKYGQGFSIARPMPANQVIDWIDHFNDASLEKMTAK